jgi:hypothetical protein
LFAIESLLPNLQDNLAQELNVEKWITLLQQHKKQTISSTDTPSGTALDENGLSKREMWEEIKITGRAFISRV